MKKSAIKSVITILAVLLHACYFLPPCLILPLLSDKMKNSLFVYEYVCVCVCV